MNKKRLTCFVVVAIVGVAFWVFPAGARELLLFDKPLTLLGYGTQQAAFGVHNSYDTEAGLQAAVMNLFGEGDYKISPELKFYVSSRLTVDWAYQLNSNRDSWEDKGFPKSSGRFNIDAKYWQILNEATATWTPGNFLFRVGKQIVSWGEVTAFRIMDQINPVDFRRPFADVEFENTIIPIWLLRAEYYPRITTSWLQDLSIEFVFNPSMTQIPNQDVLIGNDAGGIWSPNVTVFAPGTPKGEARLGSSINTIQKPDVWSPEGFSYAARVKGVVKDFIIGLNYYYGTYHSPILVLKPVAPVFTTASDGVPLIHLQQSGKFPIFRYVGLTATRDIPFLKATPLGGVAPVFRFETFYAFGSTFTEFPNNVSFVKSDELRMGLGFDWKIKVNALNPKAYFTISPEVIYRRLINFDPNAPGGGSQYYDELANTLKRNNYMATIFLSTTYFNAKLVPSVYYWRDFTQKSDFLRFMVTYFWSSNWLATGTFNLLGGSRTDVGFEPFSNKSYFDFKITYKWS
jgi:hypothetical protein